MAFLSVKSFINQKIRKGPKFHENIRVKPALPTKEKSFPDPYSPERSIAT